jgi:hypothetical protein
MELSPTKLGTKTYWDHVYEEEKHNFDEIGEPGEIWYCSDIALHYSALLTDPGLVRRL